MNSEYKQFWTTFTILLVLAAVSFAGQAYIVYGIYKILGG